MKKKGISPTQRSLKWLKEQGYYCDKVEQWIQFAPGDPRKQFSPGQRKDLFGFIDIISITDDQTLAVQSCGQSFSEHLKKLQDERRENVLKWLSCPGRTLLLIGWRKIKKVRGGKLKIWSPRLLFFENPDDLENGGKEWE